MFVAMLNTATLDKHLARYLMQERTPGVQEAEFIISHNEDLDVPPVKYDAAMVYHIVGKKMKGYLQLRHDADDELKKKFNNVFTEIEFDDDGLGAIHGEINLIDT
jgi:hypothetical protein